MPTLKKPHSSSTTLATWWRRWEQFTRHGIRVKTKRYNSAQLLRAWGLILGTLYLIVWLYGWNRSLHSNREQLTLDEEFFRDRHLVFCISGGRSGSKYLSNVLGVGEGVIALHEPEPKMTDEWLREVILKGRRLETFEQRKKVKIEAIREVLEGMDEGVVYAETSHMFVKTFADVILESVGDIAKVTVVFLRRRMKDTIWSQVKLGWFREGHSGRNVWYYDVADAHPSERMWKGVNGTEVVDLLVGYNLDVVKRGMELERIVRQKHGEGLWKRVRVEKLLLLDVSGSAAEIGVRHFLRGIGLVASENRLELLRGMDRNDRDVKKDGVKVGVTRKDVETRIDALRQSMPELSALLY